MKTLLLTENRQLASLFQAYDNGERGYSVNKLRQAGTFVKAVYLDAWIEALKPDGDFTHYKFEEIELVILPAYEGNERLYQGSERLVERIIDEMVYEKHLFVGLLEYAEDERSRGELEALGVGVFTTEAELLKAMTNRSLPDLLVSLADQAVPAMDALYSQPWVRQRQDKERARLEKARAAERELAQATHTPWNQRTFRQQELVERYNESQRRMRLL